MAILLHDTKKELVFKNDLSDVQVFIFNMKIYLYYNCACIIIQYIVRVEIFLFENNVQISTNAM